MNGPEMLRESPKSLPCGHANLKDPKRRSHALLQQRIKTSRTPWNSLQFTWCAVMENKQGPAGHTTPIHVPLTTFSTSTGLTSNRHVRVTRWGASRCQRASCARPQGTPNNHGALHNCQGDSRHRRLPCPRGNCIPTAIRLAGHVLVHRWSGRWRQSEHQGF